MSQDLPCSIQGTHQGELTIGEVIKLLKSAKLAANRRPVYVNEMDRALRQIAKGMEHQPLSFLDAPKIEAFLAGRKFCPAARKMFIGRVSTLFEFAKRRQIIHRNPCDQIEKPITEWKPPFILSPEQVEKLLRHCQQHWPERLAYLSLCTFCGLRPTEARQLSREAINLEAGTIRIEAGISKIRQRRIVQMHPTAVLWLAHALPFATLQIKESTRKRWVRDCALLMGFKEHFPFDALRHSCASYWLTVKQDAGFIAMQLGNSPAILFRHYRELCTSNDAERFWSLKP